MTFKPFPSNLRLRPRLFFCPSFVRTMKLDVIFDSARPERPTMSPTLNDGKYLLDIRWSTMLLNFSFSYVSDGKNCASHKRVEGVEKRRAAYS